VMQARTCYTHLGGARIWGQCPVLYHGQIPNILTSWFLLGCCPIGHTRCSFINPTFYIFCKKCSIYTASYVLIWYGRAVTQTVSRRLPTAKSLVRRAVHAKLRNLYCLPDAVRMIKDGRGK